MYRTGSRSAQTLPAVPHPRGDVPASPSCWPIVVPCSPPTRGCTEFLVAYNRTWNLFPTHAGMYRRKECVWQRTDTVPHPRGDVPMAERLGVTRKTCSPPTRGCTETSLAAGEAASLFPTHAGMYRTQPRTASGEEPVPHPRGDVPDAISNRHRLRSCSPPTRGCTVWPHYG